MGHRCAAILLAAAALGSGAMLASCGEEGGSSDRVATPSGSPVAADRAAAIRRAEADAALIAKRRRQVVEPTAGALAGTPDAPVAGGFDDAAEDVAPTVSATGGKVPENASLKGSVSTADVQDGIALPPIQAPEAVKRMIEAGNQIARTPYLWGGGHGKWLDRGYDCSGSVSYALAAGGFLNGPLASGPLMRWGKPGKGKWVTIYTNPGHVFMVVAGVRFDTSGRDSRSPSRWQKAMRSTAGFVARHPEGL